MSPIKQLERAPQTELKEGIADAVQGDAYLGTTEGWQQTHRERRVAQLNARHPAHRQVPGQRRRTKEEMKVTWECRKMLSTRLYLRPVIRAGPRCRTAGAFPLQSALKRSLRTEARHGGSRAGGQLSDFQTLKLSDDVDKSLYPMPITSTGNYDEVGRIRRPGRRERPRLLHLRRRCRAARH